MLLKHDRHDTGDCDHNQQEWQDDEETPLPARRALHKRLLSFVRSLARLALELVEVAQVSIDSLFVSRKEVIAVTRGCCWIWIVLHATLELRALPEV